TRERVPLEWAGTQNNLGNTLTYLGERESGTQHLTEAVAAFRAALLERTRERVPLDWAATLMNLGSALTNLAERTHDTKVLCEALRNHINAWQLLSRAAPLYALGAAASAQNDVPTIINQSAGTAPQCLQAYSAVLDQMAVPH